jgi:hypothetical protein
MTASPVGTNLLANTADDFLVPAISSKSGAGSSLFSGVNQAPAVTAGSVMPAANTVANTVSNTAANTGGISGLFDQGKELVTSAWDKINPASIKANAIPAARDAGVKAVDDLLVRMPKASESLINTTYSEAYKAALPGVIGTYGPLAAVGLAGATAMGAFTPPEVPLPPNAEQFKTTGQDLLARDPKEYGLTYGGANTTYAASPYQDFAVPGTVNFSQMADPYSGVYTGQGVGNLRTPFPTMDQLLPPQLRRFAKGGEAYPRKTGHIAGPGTGTSDSVPAMLSDGEFVFTAKAVRAMGEGSRRKGAKRMYALMKQLERKAS